MFTPASYQQQRWRKWHSNRGEGALSWLLYFAGFQEWQLKGPRPKLISTRHHQWSPSKGLPSPQWVRLKQEASQGVGPKIKKTEKAALMCMPWCRKSRELILSLPPWQPGQWLQSATISAKYTLHRHTEHELTKESQIDNAALERARAN